MSASNSPKSTPYKTPNRSYGSNSFSTPRPPLLVNDDEAEKRRRRLTQTQVKNFGTILQTPRAHAIIGRTSLTPSKLSIVDATKSPANLLHTLSDAELTRQYEEWMKIAADGVY
jgi:hypothetical protein